MFFLLPNYFMQKAYAPYNENETTFSSQNIPLKENEVIEAPLNKSKERVTKKPFGIFINPMNSPVQPERFSGYHTGVDFEVFPKELDSKIPIYTICEGKLITKRFADGYGGIAIQNCNLNSEVVTIIYGHLNLESITKNIGENFKEKEKIGILGENKSFQTDGERKHLHLGIHKGSDISLLGYVQTKNELKDWIDPCLYFCN